MRHISKGTICILGGTGFVGHHLTRNLAADGWQVLIPTRHPQRHRDLTIFPGVRLVQIEQLDRPTLTDLLEGSYAVINLAGILNESSAKGTFKAVHVDLVERIAETATVAGVQKLLHMSALNAASANGTSRYLRSKGEGESRAHTRAGASLGVTSFRPSVIFGLGDSFFNRFAGLLRISPPLFPLACAQSRFAPVYVGDVCQAFLTVLGRDNYRDKHLDLCGPESFTLQELVEYTSRQIGKKTWVVDIGDTASRLQARILQHFPGKPFTMDNYHSLALDSVCEHNALPGMGIEPTPIDAIVPAYLGQGRQPILDSLRKQIRAH